ncbi:MAG: YidH family protein [Bryobacteraceae bacterium]
MHNYDKDPRVYLAAERTILAWIRTGLALMGFGFVLARFGIFLRSLAATGAVPGSGSPTFSVSVGTALIVVGVLVEVLTLVHYRRLISELNAGIQSFDRPSSLATLVAILIAAIGSAMAVYLLFFR